MTLRRYLRQTWLAWLILAAALAAVAGLWLCG